MCTVTYLPAKEGFIITSNRDERLIRLNSEAPKVGESRGVKLLFPRDGEAGGTWIATAGNGRTVCLLNGAFVPHIRELPYRKSRGLVVLDFFTTGSAKEFASHYDLKGIENFTMLIAENNLLYELRWDGHEAHFKQLNENEAHILCSVTLYTPEVIEMRKKWFAGWLQQNNDYSVERILKFHLFAGEGDDYTNVRMSRAGIVQTVSITSVQAQKMYYTDLKEQGEANFGIYTF